MKKFIVLLFLISYTVIHSQSIQGVSTFKNTSLDVVTDIASISLGESFVANQNSNYSFFENPAARSNKFGVHVFYYYRSHGWFNLAENLNYYSIGASVSSPLENYGLAYNQYSTGQIPFSTTEPGKTTNDINRTFIFSYSRNIIDNFIGGISIKLFNHSLNSSSLGNLQITSTNTFLFDFGILYSFSGLINNPITKDKINLGISIQNFGSDYKEKLIDLFNQEINRTLPRYLRAGFAYEINIVPVQDRRMNIDLLFTGEYKSLINPGEPEKTNVDYWGGGIEVTLFKVISLRLGGVISPENNVLFDRAKITLRYGIGLNLPLEFLGLDYPLNLKFDYAFIPVNQILIDEIYGTPGKSKSNLYGFGLSLFYNGSIF